MKKYLSAFSVFLIFGAAAVGPAQALEMKSLALPTGETIEYVDVRDEPLHRHQFENERIRLYDVLIPAGEGALYHRHAEDTAYVVIQPSRFRSQTAGAKPAEGDLPPPGTAFFDTQSKAPVIHQVSNVGTQDGRLIGVELYQTDKTVSRKALSAPGLKAGQSVPQVRIYAVTLEPGQSTGPLNAAFPHLLIAVTAGTLESGTLEPGNYQWSEGAADLTLTNTGDTKFQAVLYELP